MELFTEIVNVYGGLYLEFRLRCSRVLASVAGLCVFEWLVFYFQLYVVTKFCLYLDKVFCLYFFGTNGASIVKGNLGHFPASSLKNKKTRYEKLCHIFPQKKFIIFWNMELCDPKPKQFLNIYIIYIYRLNEMK